MKDIKSPAFLVGNTIQKNLKMEFAIHDLGYILRAYFKGFLVLGVRETVDYCVFTLCKKTNNGIITAMLQVFDYVHWIENKVRVSEIDSDFLDEDYFNFLGDFKDCYFKCLNHKKGYYQLEQNLRGRAYFVVASGFSEQKVVSDLKIAV